MAREGARSSQANAVVLTSARLLLEPAEASREEVSTLGEAITLETQALNRALAETRQRIDGLKHDIETSVTAALKAAEILAAEGIEAEVIDLRTLRPLDHETIVQSVRKTNRLVTCEEGWGPMGVGAEVIARVLEHAFDDLDAPPVRVCQKDVPMPYAANLEKLALPNADEVVAAAKAVLYV